MPGVDEKGGRTDFSLTFRSICVSLASINNNPGFRQYIVGGRNISVRIRSYHFDERYVDLYEKLKKHKYNGIAVTGPPEWYLNLQYCYEKHGSTWLQQSKQLKEEAVRYFEDVIGKSGHFHVYGYETQSRSQIIHRFNIDRIVSSDTRKPPPDETAPSFVEYDRTKGHCKDGKYAYLTWLHIVDYHGIEPLEMNDVINLVNNKPIRSFSGKSHYYIYIPAEIYEKIRRRK